MRVPILCECNRLSCASTIVLEEDLVLQAHSSRCVVVVTGHEEPGEEVIRSGDGWVIVVDNDDEGNR